MANNSLMEALHYARQHECTVAFEPGKEVRAGSQRTRVVVAGRLETRTFSYVLPYHASEWEIEAEERHVAEQIKIAAMPEACRKSYLAIRKEKYATAD